MTTVFRCDNAGRLQALRGQAVVNGIDHVVVLDGGGVPDGLRQRVLLVRLVLPVTTDTFDTGIGAGHAVAVTGGVRVLNPAVRWVSRLSTLDPATIDPTLTAPERAHLAAVRAAAVEPASWLLVVVENYGDASLYRLALRTGSGQPPGFDPLLSEVDFSFKADCPSPFDCVRESPCPTDSVTEPDLDHLARDFQSFRRLMLDRLALLMPGETEGEPATLRTTLVETLAYEADRLAYFQDAVGTEAYLTTARTRPSLRRHGRLLGYRVHEGCNARGFVQVRLQEGALVGGSPLRPGCRLLTLLSFGGPVLSAEQMPLAMAEEPESFEVRLSPETFTSGHNEIDPYTWGDGDCCLPVGSTAVWLRDEGTLTLAPGDFVAVVQTADPQSRSRADADQDLRHVVRLTEVGDPVADPLFAGVTARRVAWAAADALPFPLVVSVGEQLVASVLGNLVLVDHGHAVTDPLRLESWGNQGGVRATLARSDLSWAHWPDDGAQLAGLGAVDLLDHDPRRAEAWLTVTGEGERWSPKHDLLASGASVRELVVETESDRRVRLRFGDDVNGRRPTLASLEASQLSSANLDVDTFHAVYRVGNGERGNIGAGAIAHLVADPGLLDAGLIAVIDGVTNVLPTSGGREPETLDEVRRDAPRAFRVQERAVTVADWVEMAERHPRVQRARAVLRWTGSWHTVHLTVDPLAGADAADLYEELAVDLDRYRLAGYDLHVVPPLHVPLDIALTVCVEVGSYRDQVGLALREEFSTGRTTDGRLGFFHPDRFSFGDSVWLSQVVARCMAVAGVRYVDVRSTANPHRFRRRGHPQGTEVDDGRIPIADSEIARCDNDPNAPELGTTVFYLEGGS